MKLPLVNGVTVDDPHSKDLDDAIWLEWDNDKPIIISSITDVDAVVRKGSKYDIQAQRHCFTRYHMCGSESMLPRSMSEHSLSLLPGETRQVLSAYISLDTNLDVAKLDIGRRRFSPKERMSYSQVAALVKAGDPFWSKLGDVAMGLLEKRRNSGALAMYDLAKGWYVTEDGNLVQLTKGLNNIGYIIIQELMLLTNCSVAKLLSDKNVPALYRNHEPILPNQEARIKMVHDMEEAINDEDVESVGQLSHIYTKRARLAPRPTGHYGLNVPCYMWWTSPLRRSPDLINHRITKAVIDKEPLPYTEAELVDIAEKFNIIYDEERKKDSEAWKEAAARKLHRFVEGNSLGALVTMDGREFYRALKMSAASETSLMPQMVGAIKLRLENGVGHGKELAYLLFRAPNTEAWNDLRKSALECLRRNRFMSITALNVISARNRWKYVTEYVAVGNDFYCEMKLKTDEQEYVARGCGRSKQDAIHVAAYHICAAFCGEETPLLEIPESVNMPTDYETCLRVLLDEAATNATKNPISKLFEISCKAALDPPEFKMMMEGPSHKPDISCLARWDIAEQVIEAMAKGRTKQEARTQAAIAVYDAARKAVAVM